MLLALFRRIVSYKFFPLSWTIFTIILLCIPGSIVPGDGFFGMENLDKIVHVVLFAMNVLFWGWHYQTIKLHTSTTTLDFCRCYGNNDLDWDHNGVCTTVLYTLSIVRQLGYCG